MIWSWWLRKFLDIQKRCELRELFMKYDPDALWEEDGSHTSIISLKHMNMWLGDDENLLGDTQVGIIDPKWGPSLLNVRRIKLHNASPHFIYDSMGVVGSRHLKEGDIATFHISSKHFDFEKLILEDWEFMRVGET